MKTHKKNSETWTKFKSCYMNNIWMPRHELLHHFLVKNTCFSKLLKKKETKQIVWIISLQSTASFSYHFLQVKSKSCRGHEARVYHCRVGLCQLVFLRSGKYFRKSSKMIHRSLTYDIVRVVVFACPLISIDKMSIARQNSPKVF